MKRLLHDLYRAFSPNGWTPEPRCAGANFVIGASALALLALSVVEGAILLGWIALQP